MLILKVFFKKIYNFNIFLDKKNILKTTFLAPEKKALNQL
jgi:hypothetical protein